MAHLRSHGVRAAGNLAGEDLVGRDDRGRRQAAQEPQVLPPRREVPQGQLADHPGMPEDGPAGEQVP
jgi:hypothetical protein